MPLVRGLHRRDLLRGAGAALLCAPFVSLLGAPFGRRARADTPRAADRLIVFFSPNGTVPRFWRPTGAGNSFSFPAGSILEPLAAHVADLVVCDGIDFIGVDNHEPGMAAMLTGGGGAQHVGAGMSVDQYIASRVGAGSRFASLELGVQTSAWGGNRQTRMAYSAPGVFVTPEDNPQLAWKRLFGAVAMMGGGVDKLQAHRKSILDAVRGDLGELRGRVGRDDRARLDQHLEALRRTEQGLATAGGGGVGGACSPPATPAALDVYSHANLPAVGRAQIDIAVAALACGMTRVASLQFAHTVAPQVLSFDPVRAGEGHHDLSHKDDSDAAGVAAFVRCERWFAEQFAYLLGALKAQPDPVRGGSLFDSSLVVWAKEMGDSRLHVCKSVPFVLSGGANSRLRRGQYLVFDHAPHQKLLTALCQGMGLDDQTFGDPGHGTGALPGVLS